jgi:DNA-binding transcriptional regulator YhcF (GntR family)
MAATTSQGCSGGPRSHETRTDSDGAAGTERARGHLPVLVSDANELPIYQQIAHQITYLIYSRHLADEARLPTVRALAEQLRVNPNTVTQAYSQLQQAGLIESVRGRGTFVRPLSIARDEDWTVRHELLVAELRRMRRRGHALGFTDGDVHTHLLGVVQAGDETCRARFVAPTIGATKYARILSDHLAELGVEVLPLEYEDLLERTSNATMALDEAYYVMTPVSLKSQVEDLLARHETNHRVLGITLEITPRAIERIAALGPDLRVCVFTIDRYMPIALNILHSYSTAAFANIVRLLDTTPRDRILAAFDASDVIAHTFGVSPLLDDYGVAADKRIEIEFRVSEDSLRRLHDLFAARAPGRALPGRST